MTADERDPSVDRRGVLRAAGVLALTPLAGCGKGLRTQFEATPVGLSPGGLRAFGTSEVTHEDNLEEHTPEVVHGGGEFVCERANSKLPYLHIPLRGDDWLKDLESELKDIRWASHGWGVVAQAFRLVARNGSNQSPIEAAAERDDLRQFTTEDVVTAF